MSNTRRDFLYQRLMALKIMIKDYQIEHQEAVQGEINYIENTLRADEFSTYNEYPIF